MEEQYEKEEFPNISLYGRKRKKVVRADEIETPLRKGKRLKDLLPGNKSVRGKMPSKSPVPIEKTEGKATAMKQEILDHIRDTIDSVANGFIYCEETDSMKDESIQKEYVEDVALDDNGEPCRQTSASIVEESSSNSHVGVSVKEMQNTLPVRVDAEGKPKEIKTKKTQKKKKALPCEVQESTNLKSKTENKKNISEKNNVSSNKTKSQCKRRESSPRALGLPKGKVGKSKLGKSFDGSDKVNADQDSTNRHISSSKRKKKCKEKTAKQIYDTKNTAVEKLLKEESDNTESDQPLANLKQDKIKKKRKKKSRGEKCENEKEVQDIFEKADHMSQDTVEVSILNKESIKKSKEHTTQKKKSPNKNKAKWKDSEIVNQQQPDTPGELSTHQPVSRKKNNTKPKQRDASEDPPAKKSKTKKSKHEKMSEGTDSGDKNENNAHHVTDVQKNVFISDTGMSTHDCDQRGKKEHLIGIKEKRLAKKKSKLETVNKRMKDKMDPVTKKAKKKQGCEDKTKETASIPDDTVSNVDSIQAVFISQGSSAGNNATKNDKSDTLSPASLNACKPQELDTNKSKDTSHIGVPMLNPPLKDKGDNGKESENAAEETTKRFKCQKCDYRNKWKFQIRRHERVHGIFACGHCETVLNSLQELNEHSKEKHADIKKPGRKSQAGSKLTSQDNGQLELGKTSLVSITGDGENNVTVDTQYSEEETGRENRLKEEKKADITRPKDGVNKKSPDSDEDTKVLSDSRDSSEIEAQLKPFDYDDVTLLSPKPDYSDPHKKNEEKIEEHSVECSSDKEEVKKGQGKIPCPECDKTFKYNCKLKEHMKVHDPDAPKEFACDFCEYRSKYQINVKKHVTALHGEAALKEMTCEKCGKVCSNRLILQRHMAMHQDDTEYSCPQCGHSFRLLRYLHDHMKTHQDRVLVYCEVEGCGKGFSSPSKLNAHLVEVHGGERTIACPHPGCELKFYKHSHLQRHQATHSEDRKFKCDWPDCGKAFRHRDNLKVHYRLHTNEKPVKCELCEFACRQKSSLQWHMKKHHPVEYSEVQKKKEQTKNGKQEAKLVESQSQDSVATPKNEETPTSDQTSNRDEKDTVEPEERMDDPVETKAKLSEKKKTKKRKAFKKDESEDSPSEPKKSKASTINDGKTIKKEKNEKGITSKKEKKKTVKGKLDNPKADKVSSSGKATKPVLNKTIGSAESGVDPYEFSDSPQPSDMESEERRFNKVLSCGQKQRKQTHSKSSSNESPTQIRSPTRSPVRSPARSPVRSSARLLKAKQDEEQKKSIENNEAEGKKQQKERKSTDQIRTDNPPKEDEDNYNITTEGEQSDQETLPPESPCLSLQASGDRSVVSNHNALIADNSDSQQSLNVSNQDQNQHLGHQTPVTPLTDRDKSLDEKQDVQSEYHPSLENDHDTQVLESPISDEEDEMPEMTLPPRPQDSPTLYNYSSFVEDISPPSSQEYALERQAELKQLQQKKMQQKQQQVHQEDQPHQLQHENYQSPHGEHIPTASNNDVPSMVMQQQQIDRTPEHVNLPQQTPSHALNQDQLDDRQQALPPHSHTHSQSLPQPSQSSDMYNHQDVHPHSPRTASSHPPPTTSMMSHLPAERGDIYSEQIHTDNVDNNNLVPSHHPPSYSESMERQQQAPNYDSQIIMQPERPRSLPDIPMSPVQTQTREEQNTQEIESYHHQQHQQPQQHQKGGVMSPSNVSRHPEDVVCSTNVDTRYQSNVAHVRPLQSELPRDHYDQTRHVDQYLPPGHLLPDREPNSRPETTGQTGVIRGSSYEPFSKEDIGEKPPSPSKQYEIPPSLGKEPEISSRESILGSLTSFVGRTQDGTPYSSTSMSSQNTSSAVPPLASDFYSSYLPGYGSLQTPLDSRYTSCQQPPSIQPPAGFPQPPPSAGQPTGFQVLQRSNAELLRRASETAVVGRGYSGQELLTSTPPQQTWMASQEERVRNWAQASPLSMTPDLSSGSPLTKDIFLSTDKEYTNLDPNKRAPSSFAMPPRDAVTDAAAAATLPHFDMRGMYMGSGHFQPGANPAQYNRHMSTPGPASKPYEDPYRHTPHMPDYRTLSQTTPSPADMFGRVGMNMNPSLGLDKYYYSRDTMYRPQHLASGPAAFMPQTSTSQTTYHERDYSRAQMYPQASAYPFMGDKNYPTLSSRKLPQTMAGLDSRAVAPEYFPAGPPPPQPPPTSPQEAHLQDPYRRSVIYNMNLMNRYFE